MADDNYEGVEIPLGNVELRLAESAALETRIECWSCEEILTIKERLNNDGDCIHCGVEIQLGQVE